jgi:hypothetical protein
VAGNVGIGTNNPGQKLYIYGATNPQFIMGNSTYSAALQIAIASGAGAYSNFAAAGDTVINTLSGNLILQTGAGNAGIVINASNNVGIGTTNPSTTLHVNGIITVPQINTDASNYITIYPANFQGYPPSSTNGTGSLSIGWNKTNSNGEITFINNFPGNASNMVGSGFYFYIRTGVSSVVTCATIDRYGATINGALTIAGNVGIGTANPKITIGTTINYPITTSTYGPDTAVIKPSTDIYNNGNTGANGGTIVYGKRLTISAGDLDGQVFNSGTNCVMRAGDLYLSGGSYNNVTNNGTGNVTQYGGNVFIQTGTTGPSGNPTLYGGAITFATQTNMSSQTVAEVMRITANGNVGIGTSNPSFPLTVYGSGGAYNPSSGNHPYLIGTSISVLSTTSYSAVTGWFSNDVIAGGAVGSFSDRRIKNKIEPITNALDKINNIPVVQHDYVDKVKYPRACSVGVIAQDIVSIIPDAVRYEKEFIPNIMQIPSECIRIEDYIKITCDVPMDITISDILKLVLLSEEKQVSLLYLSPDKRTIHVPAWNDDHLDQVFVYGKQIDDFHIIEKAKLGILALAGVKELYQLLMKQQSQLTELIAQVKLLTDNK